MSNEQLVMRYPEREQSEYVRVSVRGADVIALSSAIEFVVDTIMDAGSLYEGAAARPEARALDGRGTTWCINAPVGAWVVRHCRRGGALAGLLADRYVRFGAARPFRELDAAVRARSRDVATPRVVAAVVHRRGPIYRGDVATELIPDALDLAGVVFGPERRERPARLAAWRAAGRLVREAAGAGIFHADMNLKNIVIAGPPASPQAWLVDFDRGRVRRRASGGDLVRMANRLRRSCRKFERLTGQSIDAVEIEAFDRALEG